MARASGLSPRDQSRAPLNEKPVQEIVIFAQNHIGNELHHISFLFKSFDGPV
jgi:hypothetical protein